MLILLIAEWHSYKDTWRAILTIIQSRFLSWTSAQGVENTYEDIKLLGQALSLHRSPLNQIIQHPELK